jgi:hypothetical protein
MMGVATTAWVAQCCQARKRLVAFLSRFPVHRGRHRVVERLKLLADRQRPLLVASIHGGEQSVHRRDVAIMLGLQRCQQTAVSLVTVLLNEALLHWL